MNFFSHLLKPSAQKEKVFFSKLRQITGLRPHRKEIYITAFTHRSLNLKDEKGNSINFERLEFLGDSMLGIVVSSFLYEKFPHATEGTLTKYRAKIVSRDNLNQIGDKMDLVKFLDLENKVNFGKNIHGNLLEALVGAVLVDRGYDRCNKFIAQNILGKHLNFDQLENSVLSYKGLLVEWGQKTKKEIKFVTNTDDGLDPEFNYTTQIFLNENQIVKARGFSKKKSEERAAKRAFHALNIK
ncbi:MAG: ribonuclease III family protein [Flavobacteriaceae bacterium]